MKKGIMTVTIFVLAVAGVTILASVGPYRLQQARKKAAQFADESGIVMEFPSSLDTTSREELLKTIWDLAVWEQKTKDTLNQTYSHTDKEYKENSLKTVSGYAKEEELQAYAMEERWRKERQALTEFVRGTIEKLFGEKDVLHGVSEDAVLEDYRREGFPYIIKTMEAVEEGDGLKAFDLNSYHMDEDWSALSMDVAYCLYPDMMTEACETYLDDAIKSNTLYEVRAAVQSAEEFSNRYGVKIKNLSRAKSKQSDLEYASKPDVPKVGMSTSSARSTKLGAPTRTTSDSGSWAGKKHTFGDMYWDKGGRQVFKAHYRDREITEVWDTRNSRGSRSTYRPSSSSSSRKSSFDPDDHDIESYYNDYRDEYDDYDDAYDGFLDDEDAWDDY